MGDSKLLDLPPPPRTLISVTEDLLASAVRRKSSHCWVSEAIKATLPHVVNVSTDLQTIRFTDPKKQVRFVYLTPPIVQRAIIQFDEGTVCSAFDFRLPRHGQTLQMWNHHTGQKRKDGRERMAKPKPDGKRLVVDPGKNIPRVVGGLPPPLQRTQAGNMSRRRRFGLRALVE